MRASKAFTAGTLVVLLIAVCLGAIVFATSAGASTSGPIHTKSIREDSFKNYDFSNMIESRSHADWGIDMIFFGNANINKVKRKLSPVLPASGSPMYARLNNNGSGWTWDRDSGIKSNPCPTPGAYADHMRLYAPSNTDYFWSSGWGSYVIASTHEDHHECWFTRWSGESERAEHQIAQDWLGMYGGNVQWSTFRMENRMETGNGGPIIQGNHHWRQDGKATLVLVQ